MKRPPNGRGRPRQGAPRSTLARQSIVDARNHTPAICRCAELTFDDLYAVDQYNRDLTGGATGVEIAGDPYRWHGRIILPSSCPSFRRRRLELHLETLRQVRDVAALDHPSADVIADAINHLRSLVWRLERDLLAAPLDAA